MACAGGTQAAVTPNESGGPASGPEQSPEVAQPRPSVLPTASAAPETVEAMENPGDAQYPRTWEAGSWPAVPVPPRPTPRLSVSCADLLEAAGDPAGVSLLTVQPSLDTIVVRQGGGTVCSFEFDVASGPAEAVMLMTADYSSPLATSDARCSFSGVGSDPGHCGGRITTGAGSATLSYGIPNDTPATQGVAQAQALLDAARAVLERPSTLRPAPRVNDNAMGAGLSGCSPSAEQREAVFSQVDESWPDVYGGTPETGSIPGAMRQRVGVTQCWWFVGWTGMDAAVIPGAGWAVDEPGVRGTPVEVLGADGALRVETTAIEDPGFSDREKLDMTVIASARGSAVVAWVRDDPAARGYWRERLVGMVEAIIGTQP